MITEVRLKDWKSVGEATVYIDPLTMLIGINASGKSNVVEGFALLSRLTEPATLTEIVRGGSGDAGIRGGTGYLIQTEARTCALTAVIEATDIQNDEKVGRFEYEIELSIDRGDIVRVAGERLTYRQLNRNADAKREKKEFTIYETRGREENAPFVRAYVYTGKQGGGRAVDLDAGRSLLSQIRLGSKQYDAKVRGATERVVEGLSRIQLLDPQPQLMRAQSLKDEQLAPDASNIAGYLQMRPEDDRTVLAAELATLVNHLTATEIVNVDIRAVPPTDTYHVLVFEEILSGRRRIMGAEAISDGTLRYLAIVLAVLSLPRGGLLVLEEADDGLHASRTKLLLDFLREQSAARGVDILLTTHSTALLDFAGPEQLSKTMYVYRDRTSGRTSVRPVDELDRLPRVLGFGGIGTLSAMGKLEDIL